MNVKTLQEIISYRRKMCQECLTPETLQQILEQVTRKPIVGDTPYQQFMNVYRQNLFQAADERVQCSRRRKALCTLQQLNQAMDARVSGGKSSSTSTAVPFPSTIPSQARDESSLVSLEEVDATKTNIKSSDTIPQSVTMMTTPPASSFFHRATRRVSLPEVVDCCDEGIL
jgi:hypothetical protein